MEAIQNMKSKTVSEVVESCLETVREGWERTLARALEWTLHPTEEDALSELARSELIFLTLISALSSLDAEMSSILLKEVDKWSLFPRLTKYMAGKLEGEWDLPREMLDRAAKFAVILERSGMFNVPQELHCYLVQLLSGEEAGGSEDSPSHDQSKRPRKDPRSSPSQQEEENSVSGQAAGGEPHQVRCYRLVARRRKTRRQGGRGQGKKVPSHQEVWTSPPKEISRSTTATKPAISKSQPSTSPPRVAKLSTGAIPKIRQQSPQSVHSPAAGAIPKPRKAERTESSAAVDRFASDPFTEARQLTSTACQTEEPPTSGADKTTSAASQTVVPVSRVTISEAQRQLWEGVERNGSLRIEEAVLSGADLEEERDDKMIPLTAAAREGQVKAVRALLRLGAELEGRDGREQRTALHWAAAEGHEAVVSELLAAGASIEAENSYRSTPLLLASSWGHLTTVRLLVEAGANLNARNSNGNTPLALAVRRGQTAVAAFLRSFGATT